MEWSEGWGSGNFENGHGGEGGYLYEVIIAVNNSDHLNGEATKQCYRMGVFYKKEKKENVDDQTAMTTRKMRNENEEMWSVRCVESNMGEMHSALVIRTKKCQTYSWSLTKTLV